MVADALNLIKKHHRQLAKDDPEVIILKSKDTIIHMPPCLTMSSKKFKKEPMPTSMPETSMPQTPMPQTPMPND